MNWLVARRAETRRTRRRIRRSIRPEALQWVDEAIASAYADAGGDVRKADAIFSDMVKAKRDEYGLDPATILLLVRLAFLIFEAWRTMNVSRPPASLVAAMADVDETDLESD